MHMGDLVPAPDDDAGQDGDHREYAGREGEQQARTEEERHDQPESALLQYVRNLGVLIFGRGGDGGAGELQTNCASSTTICFSMGG